MAPCAAAAAYLNFSSPSSSIRVRAAPGYRRGGSCPALARSAPIGDATGVVGGSPYGGDTDFLLNSDSDLSAVALGVSSATAGLEGPLRSRSASVAEARVVKLGFKPTSRGSPARTSGEYGGHTDRALPALEPKPQVASTSGRAQQPTGLLARELLGGDGQPRSSYGARTERASSSGSNPGSPGVAAGKPPLPSPKRPSVRRSQTDVGALASSLVSHALLKDAQALHQVFNSPLVIKAFGIAAAAHEGQVRKSGDPVLVHCVETAAVLAELGLDDATVAAGLLHDVLDDTLMTEAQLRKVMPPPVVDMLLKVSRISDISQLQRDNLDVVEDPADITSLLLALADVRALLIKLADRLHNLRTLDALPRAKQLRLARETLHVFAPLANRLGVWSLKAELEDLCFACLHPADAADLAARVADARARDSLEDAMQSLSTALRAAGVDPLGMSGRPKNLYGVWRKVEAKGALDRVHDVRAVRVIVPSKADCYTTLRVLHALYAPVEGRLKDYVRRPKPNGYQSLHTVVVGPGGAPLEIQIRTEKMELLAEYGVAAHWRYKEASAAKSSPSALESEDGAGAGGRGERPHEAALVAWARYVLQWRLELVDKKVTLPGDRAAPPPPAMCALPARPARSRRNRTDNACGEAGSFEAYFAATHAPTRPAPPPCYIIHTSATAVAVREVEHGATAAQLLASGVLGAVPEGSSLLINRRPAAPGDVLTLGDEVEILSCPLPEGASPSPAASGGGLAEEAAADGDWPDAGSMDDYERYLDPLDADFPALARGGSPWPEELECQRDHLNKLYHNRSASDRGALREPSPHRQPVY